MNSNVTTTDYSGSYVYQEGDLQFIFTPEGYATPNGSTFDYVYQYKDHLGNIRLSYMDSDGNGSVSQSEIIEENNYYPFGLKHKGYNSDINGTHHRYMFGGKEFDESFDGTLNTYDFGARNYDPALGRWMNVDPLAEQMRRHSPYNYAFNNPLRYFDPDGLAPEDIIVNGKDKNGNTVEIMRWATDEIKVTFDTDFEVSQNFDSKKFELTDYQEQKIKGADAVGVNIAGGAALKFGLQGDVSMIKVLNGTDSGEMGISLGVNGLAGLEASLDLFNVSFYFAKNLEEFILEDLEGLETGFQGGTGGVGGSVFKGVEWRTETLDFETIYTGFSFGASVGPSPVDANFYAGWSTFIYNSKDD